MNRHKYINEERMINRRYGPKKTIDPDAYASEFNVRVKKNIFLQNVNSFEILEKELKEQELNGANFIISYFDDPTLNQLFLLDRELKDANLKEICKQKRETAMKVIFDRYVEKSINEEVVAPKVEITDLFNIIENYYDAFYVRNSEDKDIDFFLPISKTVRDNYKYKAFKQIKDKVGLPAIEADYAKHKNVSFAKYSVDKSRKYVTDLNNEIRTYYLNSGEEMPKKETGIRHLDAKLVAKVKRVVPTYLNLLTKSYNARSKTERFFSYFPFINKEAKEERKAINQIESLLIEGSIFKFNKTDIELEMKTSESNAKLDYYNQKLVDLKYLENEKENIIVENDNDLKLEQSNFIEDDNLDIEHNKTLI